MALHQIHPEAAPRAMPAALGAGQPDCTATTAWSPASPSFSSLPLEELKMPRGDAIPDPAAYSNNHSNNINHNTIKHSNNTNQGVCKTEHSSAAATPATSALMAAPQLELDRDMMGMLAANWNLSHGPPRAPVANWGFEPTVAETQALLDSDALDNQQQHAAVLPGTMMPTSSDLTQMMDLAVGSNQQIHHQQAAAMQPPVADLFSAGFAMPYQDCATLPVSDFPLYDPVPFSAGMQHQQQQYQGVSNQLEGTASFFPAVSGGMMGVVAPSTSFQARMGNSGATSLYEVAQPPAAALAAISGFSMPELEALQDDSDANSDWNGSSSGFSTSSPMSGGVTTPSSAAGSTAVAAGTQTSSTGKDGSTAPKKPKRIRRLCSVAGCGKRARSQDLCIAHGGGRRCMVEGCEKSSQGGNMCIKHGGGKRCKHPGCDKAAQTNSLCKAHGGGPRCQFPDCTKSSQGGGFCRAHGGGKRCAAEGCNKGTQRGDYCALHGGSRFCEVPGCMRNDRGGGFCAHHGGGKRCSMANCNRSCRRNGLCSTHLRLLGQEASAKAAAAVPTGVPAASTTNATTV